MAGIIIVMKQVPKASLSIGRSREDVERIHSMLRVVISYIETKTQVILNGPENLNEDMLDEVLTGLTKITGLISKLIPIEKEMGDEEETQKNETLLESTIDWDLLERYFKIKKTGLRE